MLTWRLAETFSGAARKHKFLIKVRRKCRRNAISSIVRGKTFSKNRSGILSKFAGMQVYVLYYYKSSKIPIFAARVWRKPHLNRWLEQFSTRSPIGIGIPKDNQDEAKLWKRKYNRGRMIEGQWIFGGIERETKTFLMTGRTKLSVDSSWDCRKRHERNIIPSVWPNMF